MTKYVVKATDLYFEDWFYYFDDLGEAEECASLLGDDYAESIQHYHSSSLGVSSELVDREHTHVFTIGEDKYVGKLLKEARIYSPNGDIAWIYEDSQWLFNFPEVRLWEIIKRVTEE